jgi:hypothetical protein
MMYHWGASAGRCQTFQVQYLTSCQFEIGAVVADPRKHVREVIAELHSSSSTPRIKTDYGFHADPQM